MNNWMTTLTKEASVLAERALTRNLIGVALFDVRGAIVENTYNPRQATMTSVNAFYRCTGYGTELKTRSLETGIKVVCSRRAIEPSSVSTDINAAPVVARWTDYSKLHPPRLADGTHRIAVLREKIIKPLELQLEVLGKLLADAVEINSPGSVTSLTARRGRLQRQLDHESLWLAYLYDEGKITIFITWL